MANEVGRLKFAACATALWLAGLVACSAFGDADDEPSPMPDRDAAVDGTTEGDGGLADAIADAAPPGFCAAHQPTTGYTLVRCDDFDMPPVSPGAVVGSFADDGGSVVRDETRSLSAPASAHATLTSSASNTARAMIAIPLSSVTRVNVSYDVWLRETTNPDPIVTYVDTGGSCSYYLFSGAEPQPGAKMRVQEHLPGVDGSTAFVDLAIQPDGGVLARNTWQRVELRMLLVTGEITLTCAGRTSTGTMSTVCRGGTPRVVQIGLPFHGSNGDNMETWIDNLVVETQ